MLVWTNAADLSDQPVAEEIPGAGSAREMFVDHDLAQQEKVRDLGEDRAAVARGTHGGIATASCSL